MELVSFWQMRPKDAPDDQANVLGGGNQVAEFLRIEIQVFVVEAGLNLVPNQLGEPCQVQHYACFRVNLAGYPYFKLIVMAMKIGIVAKPENSAVFFIRPGGIVQAVCGVEVGTTGDGDFHVRGVRRVRGVRN